MPFGARRKRRDRGSPGAGGSPGVVLAEWAAGVLARRGAARGAFAGGRGVFCPKGAAGALILDTTNTMKTIIIFSWQKCSLFYSLC